LHDQDFVFLFQSAILGAFRQSLMETVNRRLITAS
jgi:hypothetical protein